MYRADLHIHSRYSRATSKEMSPDGLAKWAKIKGIDMLGTGDFTHPQWLAELQGVMEEADCGTYRYREIDFILTAEVSNIYFKAGRVRRVHNMIFTPDFTSAAEINRALYAYGNLGSDGRPILKLECNALVKLVRTVHEDAFVVPAHIWTPHFSLFGAHSGFDTIEECFAEETPHIFALETGLSSDPAMNWRWSRLDRYTLVSNSDAHSPSKLGREANVFTERINYKDLKDILSKKDTRRFAYTVEFFPEEGKYHWDGHRNCNAPLSPSEALKINNKCPSCGRTITIGVMHRVEDLADREEENTPAGNPPFKRLVPLMEIIAEALRMRPESASVEREYMQLIKNLGSEFDILLELSEEDLLKGCPPKIAAGIINVRKGAIEVVPGYDGKFGHVHVLKKDEGAAEKQLKFF